MRLSRVILLAPCLSIVQFTTAHATEQVILHEPGVEQTIKRVAIIGAGSAGSSAAYYLRQYCDEAALPLNITVYERDNHIGGRSTTVGVYDDEENPAELGASIFVQVNKNLVNAAREFNLSTSNFQSAATGPVLGIWNGQDFVFTQASGGGWWDNAKVLWKYGLAPIRTVSLVKKVVGNFLNMYEPPHFPWTSLNKVVYDLGLNTVVGATGEQYLADNNIGGLFANDIIQASTRVNYAQNLPLIHGLETMVCMATDGAMAIEGGNWQIFAHMLDASRANVHLQTKVTRLEKLEDGTYRVLSKGELGQHNMSSQEAIYDEVVLAAPKQFSNIEFSPEPEHVPDEIPYVKLHVTLFTSKHTLSPLAFNLPAGELVPQIVLTTLPPGEQHGTNPDGVGSPGFFSISTLRPTMDTRHGRHNMEYLYKVFSPEPLNSTFLAHILGMDPHEPEQDISEEDVSWVYRKLWHSYPYEYPRVTFEELKLDSGLWYTSGIESFISTMETSSLMGMNIAKLIATSWGA